MSANVNGDGRMFRGRNRYGMSTHYYDRGSYGSFYSNGSNYLAGSSAGGGYGCSTMSGSSAVQSYCSADVYRKMSADDGGIYDDNGSYVFGYQPKPKKPKSKHGGCYGYGNTGNPGLNVRSSTAASPALINEFHNYNTPSGGAPSIDNVEDMSPFRRFTNAERNGGDFHGECQGPPVLAPVRRVDRRFDTAIRHPVRPIRVHAHERRQRFPGDNSVVFLRRRSSVPLPPPPTLQRQQPSTSSYNSPASAGPGPATIPAAASTVAAAVSSPAEPHVAPSAPSSLCTLPPVRACDEPIPSVISKNRISLQQQTLNNANKPDSGLELKQARLEQRADILLRRIDRLHCEKARSHVEGQLNECRQAIKRTVSQFSTGRESDVSTQLASLLKDGVLERRLDWLLRNKELKPDGFCCDELRYASPAALANFLKTFRASTNVDGGQLATLRKFLSVVGLDKNFSDICLEENDAAILTRVTSSLQSYLRTLQSNCDNEATESSSGGESCDEEELPQRTSEQKPFGRLRSNIERRASWQWRTERAWIGSRWSWAQFQLADLEYKIRQHVDLYKQLRNQNAQSKFTGGDTTQSGNNTEGKVDDCGSCARVRPLERRVQPRIITTAGMFNWNRKTQRSANIHCCCTPPLAPCTMCGGRLNNMQPLDECAQTLHERNALLEPTYHPVLCSYRGRGMGIDRKLQAHWHPVKSTASNWGNIDRPKKIVPLLASTEATQNVSKRLTETYSDAAALRKRRSKKLEAPAGWQNSGKHSRSQLKLKLKVDKLKRRKSRGELSRPWPTTWPVNGDVVSPTPDKIISRRHTDKHATFDINNIVIDPSVAAVTRVEKLQYKEIQTPDWRVSEDLFSTESCDTIEDAEDISDVAFLARHDVQQEAEKRRFLPVYVRDLHSTSRRSQSLDSCSGAIGNSSGATSTTATDDNASMSASNELCYTPFTPRSFPISESGFEELLQENSNNDGCASSDVR